MNAPAESVAAVQEALLDHRHRLADDGSGWECFCGETFANWGRHQDHLAVAAADAAVQAARPSIERAAKAEALRQAADDESLVDCECGHTLDEHNGLGCYARLSYTPLVICDCKLTDDRTDGDLARLSLRTNADRIEADDA